MDAHTEPDLTLSTLLVPSREAAAAMVRCHPALMDRLRESAVANCRTLNAELVHRLARSLDDDAAATAA